jgi:hypothetical protein
MDRAWNLPVNAATTNRELLSANLYYVSSVTTCMIVLASSINQSSSQYRSSQQTLQGLPRVCSTSTSIELTFA